MEKPQVAKTTSDDVGILSAAEKKAILLMRQLKPWYHIDIRLDKDNPKRVRIIYTATLHEEFPVDMI